MNRFFTRIITPLVVVLSLFSVKQTFASHAAGADISYQCLGNNQYRIIGAFYRDCSSSLSGPTSFECKISSSCNSDSTFFIPQNPSYTQYLNGAVVGAGEEVSPLCASALQQSTCNGGNVKGIQVFFYTAIVTLRPNCGFYTIALSENARNPSANLNGPTNYDLYVEATLNSNAGVCNSSPLFTSLPVPYYCANQVNGYSQGAIDSEGDSLVYTLIQPLQDKNTPIAYLPGYSVSQPMPTNGGFNFSQATGQMSFSPTSAQDYAIAVRVDEYRNGVLIGSTIRDIQFNVQSCSTVTPAIQGNLNNPGSIAQGGVVLDSTTLGVCPGASISFRVLAGITTGDSLLFSSNIGLSIPGATATPTYVSTDGDSLYVDLAWTPGISDTGLRYVTFTFTPKTCPIATPQFATYKLYVIPGTSAGPDQVYCTTGGPVEVKAINGNVFHWTPKAGIISFSADSSTITVVPTTNPATYYVESDLLGGCKNKDTMVIVTAPSYTLSTVAANDTLCLNQSTVITTTASPSSVGPFTYKWTPDTTNASGTSLTVYPRKSTTYTVQAVSAAGCKVVDSARITIEGIGPVVVVTPSANYVCPGDSVSLNTVVSAVSCGLNPNPADPCPTCNFSFATLGTGTNVPAGNTTSAQPTPFRTYWEDARIQYIYRASELTALGLSAGTITDIAFDIAQLQGGSPHDIENFSIKMGCTSINQFAVGGSFVGGLSTVFSPITISTSLGWNTFTFSNPYDWDGTSNIIIEICFDRPDNAAFIPGYDYVNSSNVGFNATQFEQDDVASGCNLILGSGFFVNAPIALRPNTRFIAGALPLANYTFSWTPSTGLSDAAVLSPKAQVNNNVTYTLNVADANCIGNATASLYVDTSVLISAGRDTIKCNNDSVMLVLRRLVIPQRVCLEDYDLTSVPYSPVPGAGSGTLANNAHQTDDGTANNVQLPFPFAFYCNSFTSCNIDANGFITFVPIPSTATNYANQTLPSVTAPNNLIAGVWDDLNMAGNNKRLEYMTTGTAPNRRFVVKWINAGYVTGGGIISFEIQLHETTNVVEVHIGTTNNSTSIKTVGIENAAGTSGISPTGRNNLAWRTTTAEAWRFTPKSSFNDITSVVWSPSTGLNVTNNDTVIASPTTNTTYVATATFSTGCVRRDTVVVSIGSFPYTLTASKDTICEGDSVTLNFNGNAVSYLWSPAASVSSTTTASTIAKPMVTTKYAISASNSTGCSITDTIPVVVKTLPNFTIGNDTTICYYDALTLSPTGGPYNTYKWNTSQATPTLTVNTPGNYFVVVSDGICNYTSDTLTLAVNPQIQLQAYSDTGLCAGDSVTLQGEPGYTGYQWNDAAQTLAITATVRDAGTYSYIALDAQGCRQQSKTATVTISTRPVLNATAAQDTFCAGIGTQLTAGNDAGVVYSWLLANSSPPNTLQGDTVTAIAAGTYVVTGNKSGCSATDTIIIFSKPSIFPKLGTDTIACGCNGNGSVVLSSGVSDPDVTAYLWSTGATTESVTVSQAGDYILSITNNVGCVATDTVNVSFRCPLPAISATPNDTIFQGDSVTLSVSVDSSYASTSFVYLWGGDTATIRNPSSSSTTAVPALTGNTLYTVTVKDATYGCVGTDSINIYSIPPTLFIVPSVFSPNGDGVNDYFYPYLPNTTTMQVNIMHIYNRYGQQVYSCTNCNDKLPNAGWNGFYNNAAEPAGAYSYFIEIQGPDPSNPVVLKKYFAQGALSLIK